MYSVDPQSKISQGCFQDLDADVLVHIISLLHPLDILNVRATCKWLQQLTFERSVWVKAVDQTQVQFYQSKPQRELSSDRIEEIALRPFKFHQNASRPQPIIKPVSILSRPEEPGTYSRHQHLLPGGRWLLSADNFGFVKLFDLEDPCSPEVLSIVAEVAVSGETQELQIHHAAGSKLVALVASIQRMEVPPQIEEFTVLEVDLTPGRVPTLEKKSKLVNIGRINCSTVVGDLFATTTVSGSVVVWNWREDAWLEILEPKRMGRNHDLRVKLNEDGSLTTFDMMGGPCRTYGIPELVPRNEAQSPPTVPIEGCNASAGERGLFSQIYIPNHWHRPSLEPQRQVAVAASARQILFYESKPSEEPSLAHDASLAYEMVGRANWTRSYLSNARKASIGRTVDGATVVMINSSKQNGEPLELHMCREASPGGCPKVTSTYEVKLPWISPPTKPTAWKVLFCPISGTVCMSHPDGTIHVFDFAV